MQSFLRAFWLKNHNVVPLKGKTTISYEEEEMFSLAPRAWNGLRFSLPLILSCARRLVSGEGVYIYMLGLEFLKWGTRRTPRVVVPLVRSYHEVHLSEEDMEENFIKGWGKGGQKVNKSNNCVQLKHKPTGITVKCHESRSLARNRVIARELLRQKLDFLYNGKESALSQEIAKKKKRKADYLRKRRKREEASESGQEVVVVDETQESR